MERKGAIVQQSCSMESAEGYCSSHALARQRKGPTGSDLNPSSSVRGITRAGAASCHVLYVPLREHPHRQPARRMQNGGRPAYDSCPGMIIVQLQLCCLYRRSPPQQCFRSKSRPSWCPTRGASVHDKYKTRRRPKRPTPAT